MWPVFFLACLVLALLLFVPGTVQLRALGVPWTTALVLSPAVSLFELLLAGVAVYLLPVSSAWLVAAVPFALAAVALVVLVVRKTPERLGALSVRWRDVALYAVCGVVLAGLVYVEALDGPESIYEAYDNAYHLNLVATLAGSDTYSFLHASIGASSGGAFYPAAWHVMAALAAKLVGGSAALGLNAANTVLIGLVFPGAALALLSALFRDRTPAIVAGGFVALAFCGFPWALLTFGPLYPNFAAYCMIPVLMTLFMALFDEKILGSRMLAAILFVTTSATVAVLHPNAIFATYVLMSPYLLARVYRLVSERFGRVWGAVSCAAALAVLLGVWTSLWMSPSFANVVNFNWPAQVTEYQAAVNALTLSFTGGRVQLVLAALVVAGACVLMYRRSHRWLVASWAVAVFMFAVCAGTNEEFRTFFSGFWYNDSYRLAAVVCLAALPLAASALGELLAWLAPRIRLAATAGVLAVVLFGIYAPSFTLQGIGDVVTAFSMQHDLLRDHATVTMHSYTEEERAFVEKVASEIEPGAVVLNYPYDGSIFAYGLDGLDTVVKTFGTASFDGTDVGKDALVAVQNLDSEEARAYLESRGIKYVLLLDSMDDADYSVWEWPIGVFVNSDDVDEDVYRDVELRSPWGAMLGLSEDSPYLTLVDEQDGMKLYEIG
jgi:hypothetical protein